MSGVLHGVVASLKAAAAAATDAFFEYVPLLLNTTSTNGAQNNTFLDSSTNNFTVTRNGDTTQGSFNPYMPTGYWSGYFDGTGDYLTAPDNAAWAFGTGAFTIEFWYNPSSLASFQVLVQQGATDANRWIAYWSSTNGLCFDVAVSGTATIICRQNATTGWSAGSWYHVAIVRNGNDFAIYRNGVSIATTTDTDTVSDYAGTLYVGGGNLFGDASTNGYLSNVRIVTGTAVYTANFTPSTTPLTAITNTGLLCLQDNRFKDNSTNNFTITRNGDTRISKFAPFNIPASYSTASYGGSGYFDGTGDYLSLADNTAFNMGSSNFTVEAWVYVTSTAQGFIFEKDGASAVSWPQYALLVSASKFEGWISTTTTSSPPGSPSVRMIGATTVSLNTWYHVAMTRVGTNATLWVNGVSDATSTTVPATLNTRNQPMTVGVNNNAGTGAAYISGYISNARIVKGTAVYTAAFTPPTAPLTAITNTSLLLNFTNAGIYDASTINDAQTVGNAQVSTTQAKWGTTSLAFDGTGDYLTVIDKPELRLGSGDFTIEGWVYLTATGVAYGLLSKGTGTTGWSVNVTSGNKLQFSYTATQLTGATSLASGTWYYFAVVRSGTAAGNLKLYLDSVLDATSAGAVTDNFNQTNVLYVGADRVAGAVLNGYLQDVRVTNGYARAISTPTAAFPTL